MLALTICPRLEGKRALTEGLVRKEFDFLSRGSVLKVWEGMDTSVSPIYAARRGRVLTDM